MQELPAQSAVAKRRTPRSIMITVGSVALGATLGFLYGRYVGCVTGHCPLTSNQWTAMAYGGFMGLLMARPW